MKEANVSMKMFRRDEGFTLVELMVVVLIIGILVAIAIPVFNAAQGTAKQRACYSNQRVIEGAVQQWLANSPANVASDLNGNVVEGQGGAGQLVGATAFIKETPKCGLNNGTYALNSGNTQCPTSGNTGHGRYQ
jgi:prepilin-type N-terminal cleavage/methylation domain-containing protein